MTKQTLALKGEIKQLQAEVLEKKFKVEDLEYQLAEQRAEYVRQGKDHQLKLHELETTIKHLRGRLALSATHYQRIMEVLEEIRSNLPTVQVKDTFDEPEHH